MVESLIEIDKRTQAKEIINYFCIQMTWWNDK